jgi:hypothetical protein
MKTAGLIQVDNNKFGSSQWENRSIYPNVTTVNIYNQLSCKNLAHSFTIWDVIEF